MGTTTSTVVNVGSIDFSQTNIDHFQVSPSDQEQLPHWHVFHPILTKNDLSNCEDTWGQLFSSDRNERCVSVYHSFLHNLSRPQVWASTSLHTPQNLREDLSPSTRNLQNPLNKAQDFPVDIRNGAIRYFCGEWIKMCLKEARPAKMVIGVSFTSQTKECELLDRPNGNAEETQAQTETNDSSTRVISNTHLCAGIHLCNFLSTLLAMIKSVIDKHTEDSYVTSVDLLCFLHKFVVECKEYRNKAFIELSDSKKAVLSGINALSLTTEEFAVIVDSLFSVLREHLVDYFNIENQKSWKNVLSLLTEQILRVSYFQDQFYQASLSLQSAPRCYVPIFRADQEEEIAKTNSKFHLSVPVHLKQDQFVDLPLPLPQCTKTSMRSDFQYSTPRQQDSLSPRGSIYSKEITTQEFLQQVDMTTKLFLSLSTQQPKEQAFLEETVSLTDVSPAMDCWQRPDFAKTDACSRNKSGKSSAILDWVAQETSLQEEKLTSRPTYSLKVKKQTTERPRGNPRKKRGIWRLLSRFSTNNGNNPLTDASETRSSVAEQNHLHKQSRRIKPDLEVLSG